MVVIQRDVLMNAIISPIRFSRTSPLKPTRWQVTEHLGCNRLWIQCGMCMMQTLLQGVKNDPVWFLNTHNVFESLVHVANKMFGLSGCSSQYRTKDLSVISFHCDFKVTLSASGATFLFWVFVSKLSFSHLSYTNPQSNKFWWLKSHPLLSVNSMLTLKLL